MDHTTLLNEILMMLRTFKDDPGKLEKLHQYIWDELYEDDPEEGKIAIPEKFQPLVRDIADMLSAGFVCYINADTLENIQIPKTALDEMIFDEMDEEDEEDEDMLFYNNMKLVRKWEKVITIEPPESHVSFRYMEDFTNDLADGHLRSILSEALAGRKPFRNFNAIIHQSAAREDWFAFRQKCLEQYAAEALAGNLPGFDL